MNSFMIRVLSALSAGFPFFSVNGYKTASSVNGYTFSFVNGNS